MPVVLTKPAQTLSGIPGTYKRGIAVTALSSAIVDSCSLANNYSVKWIVTILDNTNSKTMIYELLALNKFGVSIDYVPYAFMGDDINHDFDVQINAGNIEFTITNNESDDIEINVIRMQLIH